MATVKLPSGKIAKIPDDIPEDQVPRYVFDKLRDTPGAEEDVGILAEKYGFKTKGIGAAAGGIGGGLAGASAGAMMGAPLGPAGVLVGGLAGGVIGSGLGGYGGEWAEEEIAGVEGDPFEAGLTEAKYGLLPAGASLLGRGVARGVASGSLHLTSEALSKTKIGAGISKYAPTGKALLENASKQIGKVGRKVAGVEEQSIKETLKYYISTPKGKKALKAFKGPKGDTYNDKSIDKLLSDLNAEEAEMIIPTFFEHVLKSDPATVTAEFYKTIVNKLVKDGLLEAQVAGHAVNVLRRGGSIEDLLDKEEFTLPGSTGRGLL